MAQLFNPIPVFLHQIRGIIRDALKLSANLLSSRGPFHVVLRYERLA